MNVGQPCDAIYGIIYYESRPRKVSLFPLLFLRSSLFPFFFSGLDQQNTKLESGKHLLIGRVSFILFYSIFFSVLLLCCCYHSLLFFVVDCSN